MIHSLAGGKIKEYKIVDLAKLEFENNLGEYFLYISEIKDLKENDFVLAPFGVIDEPKKAKVIKLDKNINTQNISIKVDRLKKIFKKI